MAHRRLIIRERITAIAGAAILCVLVAGSYYYSVRSQMAGLKYVPSESSPDFMAENVALTDFNEVGQPTQRLVAQNVKHFSDERMHAESARYLTLEPDRAQVKAKADEAWSNDGLETIEFSGNVEVQQAASADGPELYFTSLYLKGFLDTHRFETPMPVFMRRGNDSFEAERGMVYDNVAHTVELRSRVRSLLHPQNYQTPSRP